MRLDRIEGLIAYVVFDAACVFGGCLLVYADAHEHLRKYYVTLVDLLGLGRSFACELE